MMNYKELLQRSYKIQSEKNNCTDSIAEYLAGYIFDIVTYDGAIDEKLIPVAIDVCEVITNRKTFEYIANENRYLWFIVMMNMDFFSEKISYGTSIRGAWWDASDYEPIIIESCGLYDEEENQILKLELNEAEWDKFIKAVIEFYRGQ